MKTVTTIVLSFLSFQLSAQFITNSSDIVNTTLVTTNGDWINAAAPGAPDGPVIVNNGTIITSDNWECTNGITGNGTFVLDYASDKNFVAGRSEQGTLIKKGAGTALVTGSFYVNDSLLLTTGLLRLSGTADTVYIRDAVIAANTNSHIEGLVAHSGSGDRVFPFGRDGHYLPLKLYRLNASRVTASVETAPVGYTKGPGVDAVIDFPYTWRVTEAIASDTAAYVEISYPNTLPVATNPIVGREVPGLRYASMGARAIDNSSGRVTVKSYSRGLKGVFTIAKGFPSDFVTDSLALVSLYNTTMGTSWTNKTNWLTGNVSTWFGVTVTGQSITALNLTNNKLSGPVPDLLIDILSLQTINLSGNQITSIPAFTENPEIENLNVSGNHLEFGALEANIGLLDPEITFNYVNQGILGIPVDEQADVGSTYEFIAPTAGNNNTYTWKLNGEILQDVNTRTVTISALDRSSMGEYEAEISNSYFPGLVLKTAPHRVTVVATISGRLLETSVTAVKDGRMTLLKINPGGVGYDTTRTQSVKTDGTYTLDKVVLDDYVLVGLGDLVQYKDYFPTYFNGSVFWEDATRIALNENRVGVDITLKTLPTVKPAGDGQLSGTFSVGNLASGRTMRERVQGAGASVRRGTRSGRPTSTLEGEDIVAFLYTNENGEFDFKDLDEGSYILNIQYPGVPMDTESDIYITLGPKAKRQNVQKVEAVAEDEKITVKRFIIVGLEEEEGNRVNVYPNPAADELFIEIQAGIGEGIAVLTDMTGKEHKRILLNEDTKLMNVKDLISGIYILTIQQQNKQISRSKIVIR